MQGAVVNHGIAGTTGCKQHFNIGPTPLFTFRSFVTTRRGASNNVIPPTPASTAISSFGSEWSVGELP